jgi:uncharacterized protein (DUF58 family)
MNFMLTTRGWWFLLTALLLLALGVLARLPGLVPVGLTLILWFAAVGAVFYVRARLAARRLEVVRTLHDDRGAVDTLWAGHPFEVRVEVRLPGRLSLPHAVVTDRIPFAVKRLSGDIETCGKVASEQPLTLSYRIRPPSPGRARFEGVRLRLADLQGFFYHDTFLNSVVEYRILPVLVDAGGRPATTKRFNLLPPPGIHRLRRPGSGSELLDLRDYLPGDPPRTIAWKVSARRDRLITKEFESEVPLRCTLFVDTSSSVRVGGPGQNALVRLVEITAAVAQANTAMRDLTGLCLFDERSVRLVRPARTPRHLIGLLNLLADTAGQAPGTGKVAVSALLPLAHAFAEEVYPSLLQNDVNQVPFWVRWLSPRPGWASREARLGDRVLAPLLTWAVRYGLVSLATGLGFVALLLSPRPAPELLAPWGLEAYASDLMLSLLLAAAATGAVALPLGLAYFLLMLFAGRRRRHIGWRKRLAALLSVRHGLAPGGLAALLEDDELMAVHLQRFLAEHQVPFALPLYDRQGRYQFAAPEKVEVLARALSQAVGKGHDNELFVLLADLLELPDQLDPLLRAVRVAQARHHQVVVVCPWPPGLPRPDEPGHPSLLEVAARGRGPAWVARALSRATALRFRRAYQDLRQRFARLGVPVVCAADDESVALILDRLERLRMLGRRR